MSVRKSKADWCLRLSVESLEGRAVPATFGVPWSDPSHLTLSFVPDGTAIAGHTSTLSQFLGASQPSATWQRDILRAFQTWAVNGNINIGLVPDLGQPLGVAGRSQHDARFGDVRVGAQAMAPDALSISVPNDPSVSSTLTGDVLINTLDKFDGHSMDLFAVMLHEAGHSFGLDHGTDPKSPLFSQYLGTSKLTVGDIASLQSLYGTRAPDANEGSGGNDSISRATTIQSPGGFTGATPLVAFGDVTTNKDVDVFSLKAPNGYKGPVTFRLQSAGISLLAPHLSILDGKGKIVGDAQAASDLGDVVTIHLNSVDPNATYFLKVQGASNDVFGIGGYGVAVTFDAATKVRPSAIDAVLRGPYQTLNPNDLYALFLGTPGTLLNNDRGTDDTTAGAASLASAPGYARNSHYDVIASLGGPADTDNYRIQTADSPRNGAPLVLTVTVRALDVNGTAPRVKVLDRDGIAVTARVIANGNGTFTVQAVGVKPGGAYYLKVGPSAASGSAASGNYSLTAQFGTAAAKLAPLASGKVLSPASPSKGKLYVGESQLMNLVLSANPGGLPVSPGSAVEMALRNASGNVVYRLTAASGDVVSGAALFLTPGAYTVTFTTIGSGGSSLGFSLEGDGISDPIGPVLNDPTLAPDYSVPGLPGWFLYPGGLLTGSPFEFTPMTI